MQIIDQIIQITANHTGITPEQIKSPSRKGPIAQARHISMALSRWYTKYNLLTISVAHNRVNHATVLNACENAFNDSRKNPKFRAILEQCEAEVKSLTK